MYIKDRTAVKQFLHAGHIGDDIKTGLRQLLNLEKTKTPKDKTKKPVGSNRIKSKLINNALQIMSFSIVRIYNLSRNRKRRNSFR